MIDLSRYVEDNARLLGDYRWPVVSSPYTRWSYITALVINHDPDVSTWVGSMPTAAEIAVVDSFHVEYCTHWYNTGWLNRMREKHAVDVDGGANTRYLLKVADGSWKYRLRTWSTARSRSTTRSRSTCCRCWTAFTTTASGGRTGSSSTPMCLLR